MLGTIIAEEQGQITGSRVLRSEGTPLLEISYQATGRLLDLDVTSTATYETVTRSDGTQFGEGRGVVISTEGDIATWKGQGVGHLTAQGIARWRGAIFFESRSPKLTQLSGMACVYEYEVDESGKTSSRVWEWK